MKGIYYDGLVEEQARDVPTVVSRDTTVLHHALEPETLEMAANGLVIVIST